MSFNRKSYEHNYFVNTRAYFRVGQWGFDKAKELAIGYRRRLEYEWEELKEAWSLIEEERYQKRVSKRLTKTNDSGIRDMSDSPNK